jgi:hypothetical protein
VGSFPSLKNPIFSAPLNHLSPSSCEHCIEPQRPPPPSHHQLSQCADCLHCGGLGRIDNLCLDERTHDAVKNSDFSLTLNHLSPTSCKWCIQQLYSYFGSSGNDKIPTLQLIYVGTSIKVPTQQTTQPSHHGELPPPPAAWIQYLYLIQRKPNVDEGLGEGVVEAIQCN